MDVLNTVLMLFFYAIVLGGIIGIIEGLLPKNRDAFELFLRAEYERYNAGPLSLIIIITLRSLIVLGVLHYCGNHVATLAIIQYCVEAALVITIGKRPVGAGFARK